MRSLARHSWLLLFFALCLPQFPSSATAASVTITDAPGGDRDYGDDDDDPRRVPMAEFPLPNLSDTRDMRMSYMAINVARYCSTGVRDEDVCDEDAPRVPEVAATPYVYSGGNESLVECTENDTNMLVMSRSGHLKTVPIGALFGWHRAVDDSLELAVLHPSAIICGGEPHRPRKLTDLKCSSTTGIIIPQSGTVVEPVVHLGCVKEGDADVIVDDYISLCPHRGHSERMSLGARVSVRCDDEVNDVPEHPTIRCTARGVFKTSRKCVKKCVRNGSPVANLPGGAASTLRYEYSVDDPRKVVVRCANDTEYVGGTHPELVLSCDPDTGLAIAPARETDLECGPPRTCMARVTDRVTNQTLVVYVPSGSTDFIFQDKIQCTCPAGEVRFENPACAEYAIDYPHVPPDVIFRTETHPPSTEPELFATMRITNDMRDTYAAAGVMIFRDSRNSVNNPYVNLTGNQVVCVGERDDHVIRYTVHVSAFEKVCSAGESYALPRDDFLKHRAGAESVELTPCGPLVVELPHARLSVASVLCDDGERAVHYYHDPDLSPPLAFAHYKRVDDAFKLHKQILAVGGQRRRSGGGGGGNHSSGGDASGGAAAVMYDEAGIYHAYCSRLYGVPRFKSHYDDLDYSCNYYRAGARKRNFYLMTLAFVVAVVFAVLAAGICLMMITTVRKDFVIKKRTAELEHTRYAATEEKQRLQSRLQQRLRTATGGGGT